ncbi:tRNA guanosine(34) transglycosylase Tgt [Elusimicrobiota bacterium]
MNSFEISYNSKENNARVGIVTTPHGSFTTPAFMAVGTQGTVKGLTPEMIRRAGSEIILGNNYWLTLRPGLEVIKEAGGLHSFMSWYGPILTDSGGYQVFSLSDIAKIRKDGVEFRSQLNGDKFFFSPKSVIRSQSIIGSDIMMPLDDCAKYPASRHEVEKSVERTSLWAEKCKESFLSYGKRSLSTKKEQMLFGIVQGGVYKDLRERSCGEIVKTGFDGYSIGGVSVGEPRNMVRDIISFTSPLLPVDKPKYVMGLGDPADLLHAVETGCDMFDCVIPTRHGRTGWLYTSEGLVVIRNAPYRNDFTPLDRQCSCYTCTNFSRAYLHHIFRSGEILSSILNSLHNLHFMIELTRNLRIAIRNGTFKELKQKIYKSYYKSS